METPGGYLLIKNNVKDSTPPMHHLDAINITSKVCPNPFNFPIKKKFEKHSRRMYNGRKIKKELTRNISEDEIKVKVFTMW